MADQEEQFCAVTGATRERARFFLDAAAGDVQRAVAAFYEDRPAVDLEEEEELVSVPTQTAPPSQPTTSSSVPPPKQKSGVATLSDYQPTQRDTKDDDSEKFFAGGSEHSGQMISGPPRKKRDVAEEVFEAAKKQGAVPVEEAVRMKPPSASMFQGKGFRLGDTEAPSEMVAGPSVRRNPQKVSHKLMFWKNGFSVDNGPLRNGQSPEDQQFLQSVSKGEIPQELIHAAQGGEVDIDIEDKRNEMFVPPKVKVVAFSGAGHKLGNLTPELSSPASQPTAAPTASPVVVDDTQPTTSLQIRLADGTRLRAKFNHTHTVADIRRFIESSHPNMIGRDYLLMTTFPNRPLTDPHVSLADAQLLNSVIVQKM